MRKILMRSNVQKGTSDGFLRQAGICIHSFSNGHAPRSDSSMGLLNSLGKSAEKVTISRAPEERDY